MIERRDTRYSTNSEHQTIWPWKFLLFVYCIVIVICYYEPLLISCLRTKYAVDAKGEKRTMENSNKKKKKKRRKKCRAKNENSKSKFQALEIYTTKPIT